MHQADIHSIELKELVYSERNGYGRVIEVTEKPSITIKFDNGEKKKFTVKNISELFQI